MKQIKINGESWEIFDAVAEEFEKLVRLSKVLISCGDWHRYKLENDLDEWNALSQELRDAILKESSDEAKI